MSVHGLTWEDLVDMIDQLDGSGVVITDRELFEKETRILLGYDDED